MYTDPTGQFLFPSTEGNEYILCRYDYYLNHVFAEPMKNRKKASQIKAVTTIIRKLKAAVLRPTFHILNYYSCAINHCPSNKEPQLFTLPVRRQQEKCTQTPPVGFLSHPPRETIISSADTITTPITCLQNT